MIQRAHEQGFSAVELMVSLFIAVAFIATGYQLYSVVVTDGAATRQRAQASSIAYSYLRTLSDKPTGACQTDYTFSPTPVLTTAERSQLPENATLSATTSCPYGTTSNIWRITVKITYGSSPQQEISHAIFATR